MVYARQQPEAFSDRTGKPDIRGAYGLLGREVIQALKHLQHATGKTVIFVGVLEKVTDEFNVSTWQPQMEGSKAGRELPGIVDQVISLHLFSRDAEGNYVLDEKATERRLVCRAGNPYGLPAKDRSGRLDVTEPPDLGALLAKINTPTAPIVGRPSHPPQPEHPINGDTHVRPQRCPAADAAGRRTDPRRHLRQGEDDHPPRRRERLDADRCRAAQGVAVERRQDARLRVHGRRGRLCPPQVLAELHRRGRQARRQRPVEGLEHLQERVPRDGRQRARARSARTKARPPSRSASSRD